MYDLMDAEILNYSLSSKKVGESKNTKAATGANFNQPNRFKSRPITAFSPLARQTEVD